MQYTLWEISVTKCSSATHSHFGLQFIEIGSCSDPKNLRNYDCCWGHHGEAKILEIYLWKASGLSLTVCVKELAPAEKYCHHKSGTCFFRYGSKSRTQTGSMITVGRLSVAIYIQPDDRDFHFLWIEANYRIDQRNFKGFGLTAPFCNEKLQPECHASLDPLCWNGSGILFSLKVHDRIALVHARFCLPQYYSSSECTCDLPITLLAATHILTGRLQVLLAFLKMIWANYTCSVAFK